MCGIGGIWHPNGAHADHLELCRMMSAMAHRGPEGASFARLDGGALLFGFLRLGFTAGGTVQQPLYNEDHSVALVHNGEIYDHAALSRDLTLRGHRFRTQSDSETVLHLYEERGEACVEQLNGEFAFVLWDARSNELRLARDAFGVKPLYYAWHRGAFVFASEVKGLHALTGFSAELDARYWTGPGVGLAESTRTPFVGVSQVRPGHVLRVSAAGVRSVPYFLPVYGTGEQLPLDEAADRVRATLTDAVRRRLDGDPPIALSLSSGLDSTILCGLAADDQRQRGRRLHAFSLGYDGAPYDESAAAARTALHHGAQFHRVHCTPELLVEGLLDGIRSVEVPSNSLSTTARLVLTRAVRDAGFKALLSGEGADELFGGYPYFGAEAIWRMLNGKETQRASGAVAWQRFCSAEAPSRGVFWDDDERWRNATNLFSHPSAYEARVRRVSGAMPWMFSGELLGALGEHTPMRTAMREFEDVTHHGPSPFDVSRTVARRVLGSLVIPSLGDRVEMAHSLEGRTPYLDRDVVALAYSLTQAHCIEPHTLSRKHVLRTAFASLLPPNHRPPPKHTQMAPRLSDIARVKGGREILETLLDAQAVRRVGVFNPVFVRGLRAAWRFWPESDSRHATLDRTLTYVALTQALALVHVEDLLGKRDRTPALALDDDRSPPPQPATAESALVELGDAA